VKNKTQGTKDSKKHCQKKKTIDKTVDTGERRAKTGRNDFEFEDLSSDEGRDTFCLVCSEQYVYDSNYE